MNVADFPQNYDENGNYIGVFNLEPIYGPHVRRCVCKPCHAAFLAESKLHTEQHLASRAALHPAELARIEQEEQALIDDILNSIEANPKPKAVPAPATVKVGDVVTIRTKSGASLSEGRKGMIVEMPGPSQKYGGRDAERIEVVLFGNADYETETIWTDNNQWGWLELAA